eukprot:scaffold657436_cov59-Prasinocladus_malaysianus.AAC.2
MTLIAANLHPPSTTFAYYLGITDSSSSSHTIKYTIYWLETRPNETLGVEKISQDDIEMHSKQDWPQLAVCHA